MEIVLGSVAVIVYDSSVSGNSSFFWFPLDQDRVSIVSYRILVIADSEDGGKFSSVWLLCFLSYHILIIAVSEDGGKFSSVWLSYFLAGRLRTLAC